MVNQAMAPSETYRILIADDEPDIHAITKLTLKGIARKYGPLEFVSAYSGAETMAALRQYPDIAVILLDVVMETDHAGLEACRAVRGDLGNRLVRILLRTGQPGVAPEQQTIDTYDIDGYLAKTETSASRLHTAVRCALKSYMELVALERHRAFLAAAHDCATSLAATVPVEQILRRILDTVFTLCPAPFAALRLETLEETWGPRHLFLYLSSDTDPVRAEWSAAAVKSRVEREIATSRPTGPAAIAQGFFVPIALHHELGRGWLFVEGLLPDDLTRKTLTLLAAHAQNAIYASVALAALRERRGSIFEEAAI